MDDRGEKIVNLAREIMHKPDGAAEDRHHGYSFSTVVLAAMIGAAGAGSGAALLAEHYRPLNRYERIELQALIHYAAQTRKINGLMLQADFFTQFGIRSFDELNKAQMQEARDYLQKRIREGADR